MSCSDIIGELFIGRPSKEELVQPSNKHGYRSTGFMYPLNQTPVAYIKCGATLGESRNQLYTLQCGANVPRIYQAFQRGWYACILTEYIEGWTLHDWLKENSAERDWAVEQVARIITQMSQIPVPDGASPCPAGGGYAQHRFFRDSVAPRVFDTVASEDLQNPMKKQLLNSQRPWTLGPLIDFSAERMLTQISTSSTSSSPQTARFTLLISKMQVSSQPRS